MSPGHTLVPAIPMMEARCPANRDRRDDVCECVDLIGTRF
jgi:hypothetical protein